MDIATKVLVFCEPSIWSIPCSIRQLALQSAPSSTASMANKVPSSGRSSGCCNCCWVLLYGASHPSSIGTWCLILSLLTQTPPPPPPSNFVKDKRNGILKFGDLSVAGRFSQMQVGPQQETGGFWKCPERLCRPSPYQFRLEMLLLSRPPWRIFSSVTEEGVAETIPLLVYYFRVVNKTGGFRPSLNLSKAWTPASGPGPWWRELEMPVFEIFAPIGFHVNEND